MALPLRRRMFPVEGLSKVLDTHTFSRQDHSLAEQKLRGAVRQFEILTGAGKSTLIADVELNAVMGGFQLRYLQRFRIPTVGTGRRPPHILLCDAMMPPLHITVGKQAGEEPYFKVDLRCWG